MQMKLAVKRRYTPTTTSKLIWVKSANKNWKKRWGTRATSTQIRCLCLIERRATQERFKAVSRVLCPRLMKTTVRSTFGQVRYQPITRLFCSLRNQALSLRWRLTTKVTVRMNARMCQKWITNPRQLLRHLPNSPMELSHRHCPS